MHPAEPEMSMKVVADELQKIERQYDDFLRTAETLSSETAKKEVDKMINHMIDLRARANGPQRKIISKNMHAMLIRLMSESQVPYSIKTIFVISPPQKTKHISVPALLFASYYPSSQLPFSLCSLAQEASYQACTQLYAVIYPISKNRSKQEMETSIEHFLSHMVDIIANGLGCIQSDDAEKRYQSLVQFLYECFDKLDVSEEILKAFEAAFKLSPLLGNFASEQQAMRKIRYISAQNLQTSLNTYESESWLGWFWNILLCGAFGKHESYTIMALKRLLNASNASSRYYSEEEILDTLKAEPRHQQYRLGFFESKIYWPSYCGTERVLIMINNDLKPRI